MTYGPVVISIVNPDFKGMQCIDNAMVSCRTAILDPPLGVDPGEDRALDELTDEINERLRRARAVAAQNNEEIDWIISFDDEGNVIGVSLARINNNITVEFLQPR